MQRWCKVRFSFTTVESHYYAGGQTDYAIIEEDIERKLPPHIKKSQQGRDKSLPKGSLEYSISYDDVDLPKQKEEGSFAWFLAKDPCEELLEDDIELVKNIIKKTHGVSKDADNKVKYKIIPEGAMYGNNG
ncbi:MAG: hypothetical protein KGI33_04330 [Thaumarchaeota archaeon]|nr:hypothetical protein [Nitrososphaerota archaeon]